MESNASPYKKFHATITTDSGNFENVLCELTMPRRVTDKVQVRLIPTAEQFIGLGTVYKFGLLYEDEGCRITAVTVYREGGGLRNWGTGVQDQEVVGRAADLTITWHEASSHPPFATFALTPNLYLRPWKSLVPLPSGEVVLDHQERFAFPALGGGWVTFDTHYRTHPQDGGQFYFPELVAECELPPGIAPDQAVEELDDFLLIVSFATRQRVVCLGWSYSEAGEYTVHYRHDRVLPKEMPDHSFNDTLIFQEDFTGFLIRAYPVFQKHGQQPLLRQALQRLTFFRDQDTATETRYLSLYATLETLVQAFLEQKPDCKTVIPGRQWKLLRENLKETLRGAAVPKGQRALIYPALDALNRAPLKVVLHALCDDLRIELADLWPLADDTDGITLTQIRNKLLHGYFLGEQFSRSLWVARVHLEWTVERLLLAMLGWPPREHSLVHWMPLKRFFPYHRTTWQNAREELSGAQ